MCLSTIINLIKEPFNLIRFYQINTRLRDVWSFNMILNQTNFQDATSTSIKHLIIFHDEAITLLIFIRVYVAWVITRSIIFHRYSCDTQYNGHELESIWTLIPSLVLVFLALPSLHLLYTVEETEHSLVTVKITGYQWFWSYEYPYADSVYDAFILCEHEIEFGGFRLLETDNSIYLPYGVQTRMLITAADVLHSWTIPRLGVKADAVPGRLNQILITPEMPGIYYGQCSEICGANHSFIPIKLEIVDVPTFLLLINDWIKNGPPWSFNPTLNEYVQYQGR